MAGHSHAHNVAIRKGKQDKKRAIEFSKASKLIMIAARSGADPDSNFQLRHAIQKAKEISVPKDKIEHAIKKGAGLLEGEKMEPVTYEGYAPGGVAILVECLTDNLNRTAPMIRTIFDKNGGNLGTPGSVSYQFERKGLFVFDGLGKSTEEIEELLMLEKEFDVEVTDLGEGRFEVLSSLEDFQEVTEYLSKEFQLEVSELSLIPNAQIALNTEQANEISKILGLLEENDDVTNVYTNGDLSEATE